MTAAYEHDGDLTREQILASVMTFAKKAAWRAHSKAPAATELDELYALALFGIAQADARFDSYCAEHGYNPEVLSHYRTYLTWRMNGAIMDALRAADWMTRSARTDLKAITAAAEGGDFERLTDGELAARAGIPVERVRKARAQLAEKPVTLDSRPPGPDAGPYSGNDPAEPEDVESKAVVSSILQAAVEAIGALPPVQQFLVVLRYFHDMTNEDLAEVAGVDPGDVPRELDRAVLEIHSAMVKAAS